MLTRHFFPQFFITILTFTLIIVIFPHQAAHALTYTVNNLADTDDSTCDVTDCTLREAINAANTSAGSDTIDFSVTGPINLLSALPGITDSLTIDGSGITIDGANSFGIFGVSADFSISGLTLTHGAASSGAALYYDGGTLTITNVNFVENTANGNGGAIYINSGTSTVTSSAFTDNTASGAEGGAIYALGALTVSNSTFTGNSAQFAGAIRNGVTLTVSDSTFTDNSSVSEGGAIADYGGTVTVSNSTFTGNSSNLGGGIYSISSIDMTDSFMFGNSASDGDAIYGLGGGSVGNTCIVGNGDTAIINTFGTLTATGNWWGSEWGPNITGATAGTGSTFSSGDSINGTGEATSNVDVGIATIPDDYGTDNDAPTGDWLMTAPEDCPVCDEVSGAGSPRICVDPRP